MGKTAIIIDFSLSEEADEEIEEAQEDEEEQETDDPLGIAASASLFGNPPSFVDYVNTQILTLLTGNWTTTKPPFSAETMLTFDYTGAIIASPLSTLNFKMSGELNNEFLRHIQEVCDSNFIPYNQCPPLEFSFKINLKDDINNILLDLLEGSYDIRTPANVKIGDFIISQDSADPNNAIITIAFLNEIIYQDGVQYVTFEAEFSGTVTTTEIPGTITDIEFKYEDNGEFGLEWEIDTTPSPPQGTYTMTKGQGIYNDNSGNGTVENPYANTYIRYNIIVEAKNGGNLRNTTITDILSNAGFDITDLDLELIMLEYNVTTTKKNTGFIRVTEVDNNLEPFLFTHENTTTFKFDVSKYLPSDDKGEDAVVTKVELRLYTRVTEEEYIKALEYGDGGNGFLTVKNKSELISNDTSGTKITESENIISYIKRVTIKKDDGVITSDGEELKWKLTGFTEYMSINDGDAAYIVDFIPVEPNGQRQHSFDFESFGIVYTTYAPDGTKTLHPSTGTTSITVDSYADGTPLPLTDLTDVAKVKTLFAGSNSTSNALHYTTPAGDTIVIIKLKPAELNAKFEITYNTIINPHYVLGSSTTDIKAEFKNTAYLLIDYKRLGNEPGSDNWKPPYGEVSKTTSIGSAYVRKGSRITDRNTQEVTWDIFLNDRRNEELTDFFINDIINLDLHTFVSIKGAGNIAAVEIGTLTKGTWYAIEKTPDGKMVFTTTPISGLDNNNWPSATNIGNYFGCYQYFEDTGIGPDGQGEIPTNPNSVPVNRGTITIYIKKLEKAEKHEISVVTKVVSKGILEGAKHSYVYNRIDYTATSSTVGDVTGVARWPNTVELTHIQKNATTPHSYETGDMGWDIIVNYHTVTLKDVVVTDILPEGLRYQPESFVLGDFKKSNSSCNYTMSRDSDSLLTESYTIAGTTITITEYFENGYYYYKIDLTDIGVFSDTKTLSFMTDVTDYTKMLPATITNVTYNDTFRNRCYLDGKVYRANHTISEDNRWHAIDAGKLTPKPTEVLTYDNRLVRDDAYHILNLKPAKYGDGESTYIDGDGGTTINAEHVQWRALVPVSMWKGDEIQDVVITDVVKNGNLIMDMSSIEVHEVTLTDDANGKTIDEIVKNEWYTIGDSIAITPEELTSGEKGFKLTVTEALKGKMLLITYITFIDVKDTNITIPKSGANTIEISYKGSNTVSYVGEGSLESSYEAKASASGSYTVMPKITIKKVSSEKVDGNFIPIEGVEFSLIGYKMTTNGNTATIDTSNLNDIDDRTKTTNVNGIASFSYLDKNYLYILTEVDTPDNYKKLNNPIYIVVGDTITSITDNNGGTVIDNSGETLIKLTPDTKYTYTINDSIGLVDTETGTITSGSKYDITFIIENDPASTGGPAFPHTGGIGRETTATIGIGLLLTSALASTVILAPNRKKDKDAESKLPKSRKRK